MIKSLLVANRGEIARRVLRACRDLGIATVAVHSDPDAGAPHVREADAAGRLPGASPAETYLSAGRILAVAEQAGADAVHPGYGFLSENADFARAVIDAGLTWVGPPPAAIAAMGSKIEAKKLMAAADVPVLPDLDPAGVPGDGFPLLVKASAGGGGRGMRIVREPGGLQDALAAARREAESAFGDPTVFCEPLLEDARHIEVQILADAHGTVWALGERECSIQRRHQKIVEEAPSPAVGPDLRARLCEAAANAARAIGYEGAGTVEFMLAPDGRFFFLEVNTRLQVEHPVTECVYGVDLVRLQIEVAEGARLPKDVPEPRGHAIEVRLYAEDPAQDWRPASGTLHTFEVPGADAAFAVPAAHGLRLDSGVESGAEVGVHYDPMLAKLIAWAPSRAAAARRLAAGLRGARIHGLTTNRDLLVRILEEPTFLDGDTDTGYLDRVGLGALAAPLADEAAVRISALAAALAQAAASRAGAAVLGGLPSGWRNVRSQPQRRTFHGPHGRVDVDYDLNRGRLTSERFPGVSLVSAAPEQVVLDRDGLRETFTVTAAGNRVHVDSRLGPVTLDVVPRFADPSDQIAPGSLLAPMPGTVVRVEAEAGAEVAAGQVLVVLEAMKMEHRVAAPSAGTVTELNVAAGRQVESGAVLAVIERTPG
ncbi:biotin carboxylase N-terminal domain-containing protein [Actinomadura madurae]|uniref:Propionyl-CoA carboxylase alpha chain n=1 Tax=Actinomadura madurae TaxID=1993 RepID=A0A1I5H4Q3_9ACTN|nr:biotin carboxylase N-terminal domain-containing protein [Actinomadura madurae]SFO43245.1 propionyl-CoA carboxylase alpha chain [Actinomadura madurae]SPT57539.1 Acetyl-/propionyl-coenzyme A carboxylase alpha chain [Actinomadura madurae]